LIGSDQHQIVSAGAQIGGEGQGGAEQNGVGRVDRRLADESQCSQGQRIAGGYFAHLPAVDDFGTEIDNGVGKHGLGNNPGVAFAHQNGGDFGNADTEDNDPLRCQSNEEVAVGRTILIAAYHILKEEVEYQDLGGDYFVRRDAEKTKRRLSKQLEQFGYQIELKPLAQAA
jgi:hypothetical protein